MYEGSDDEKEQETTIAAWGLKGKLNVTTEEVGIWPENLQAFNLFNVLSTQWRVGMSGYIGLDYNVLFHKLDRMNLTPNEYQYLEDDIRTMEYAALRTIRKKEANNGK